MNISAQESIGARVAYLWCKIFDPVPPPIFADSEVLACAPPLPPLASP